jgi:hypothetical protein
MIIKYCRVLCMGDKRNDDEDDVNETAIFDESNPDDNVTW